MGSPAANPNPQFAFTRAPGPLISAATSKPNQATPTTWRMGMKKNNSAVSPPLPDEFPYDVFLSHRAKGKAMVRSSSLSASTGERAGVRCRSLRLAERLRADGVKMWFDE